MTYVNTTSAPGVSVGSYFAAMQHNIVTRVLRGHHYRKTFQSLSALTNAQLDDLGLEGADLRKVALESARAAIV